MSRDSENSEPLKIAQREIGSKRNEIYSEIY
jgi:hypothetical protein